MDDYLSKPVRTGELQAVLERWGARITKRSDTAFFTLQSITKQLLDASMVEELRGMSADGDSMLKELIDLFLADAPQRIALINQSITEPQKLAFQAHALKSMSLNLGANRLAEICQQLEELAPAGHETAVTRLAQELERTFRETEAELIPLRAREK